MRTVIHKLFWAWDFDKEEAWLNEMAAQGLVLVGVGWCRYEFEPCEPGEYGVRIQLLDQLPSHPESAKYLAFLEETGVEQVGSWWRWIYVRKKTADGEFELFSDNASKLHHISGVMMLLGILGGMNLFCGAYNILLWLMYGMGINLLGLINLLLGALCVLGLLRLRRVQVQLKKDEGIFG